MVRHDQVRVGADAQARRGRRPWRAARPARRSAPSGRSRRRCRSRTACPDRGSRTGSGGTSSARRRARSCGRRCCRPGSGSPCPPSRRAGRRPCPCPRRPTGRPRSRFRPCRGISLRRAARAPVARRVVLPVAVVERVACGGDRTGSGSVARGSQAPVVAEHRQRIAAHLVQPRHRPVADLLLRSSASGPVVPLVLRDVRGGAALAARSGSWSAPSSAGPRSACSRPCRAARAPTAWSARRRRRRCAAGRPSTACRSAG